MFSSNKAGCAQLESGRDIAAFGWVESPTTTTCASGKLAFVALRSSARWLLSRTPMKDQDLLAGAGYSAGHVLSA
jgi:hypothetical protein